MNEVINTIVLTLLSALVSSFLAAYLIYRYMELSWRKRKHFEDIKLNCLEKQLSDVERFEDLFRLSEDQISAWVREPRFPRNHLLPYGVQCFHSVSTNLQQHIIGFSYMI